MKILLASGVVRMSRSWLTAYAVLFFAITTANAQAPRITLGARPMQRGGTCGPNEPHLLAGSTIVLSVGISGLTEEEWKNHIVLQAALDLPKGEPFRPTPGLVERMDTIIFDFRTSIPGIGPRREAVTLPEDLSVNTVTFLVSYRSKNRVVSSAPCGPFMVIPPCSRADTAQIAASRIFAAFCTVRYQRGVDAADAMLGAGLSNELGWYFARKCARAGSDKEKKYLERALKDFGRDIKTLMESM